MSFDILKNMKKSSLQIGLPITIFKEGKNYVAYSPALDLSTSASTYEKAQSRFLDATQLFLEELVEMGTLDQVLTGLGWQKVKTNWQPPVVISSYTQPVNLIYA
jgi:hypothetical protein